MSGVPPFSPIAEPIITSVVVLSRIFSVALVSAVVILSRITLPLPDDVGRVAVQPAAVAQRASSPAVRVQVEPQVTGASVPTALICAGVALES